MERACFLALEASLAKLSHIEEWHYGVAENVCQAIALTEHIEGDWIEIGTYKGGTALVATEWAKASDELRGTRFRDRHFVLVDTFEGFSYGERRGMVDPIWWGTHKWSAAKTAMAHVRSVLDAAENSLSIFELNVISMPLPQRQAGYAFALIDVDSYEATRAALEAVWPLVNRGGVCMVEDAPATPALYGAYLALHDFLDEQRPEGFALIHAGHSYFVLKR